MSGQLDGKVIWVTGAGRGLGGAYAEGLAREGATAAVSDIAGTDEAVAAIRAAGGKAAGFVSDVTDEAPVLRCAADIEAQIGSIEQTDAAFSKRMFRINVLGSFRCIGSLIRPEAGLPRE